ncbi:hypothetical protein PgNI_11344 [Pyricularia grisea]|uniref:Uncharacterized protein n=1 Tax=Pyricularia grisea TaxID=148305 RepID=A0A6P8APT9_PYRGI|nr:hypothetical protein PgNI_11344 [Pyricularia grisea]TLD04038.1 hypothetical protein PgNI_11344 [Pyricularia grisea]
MHAQTFFTAALGLMAASTALATPMSPISHGNQVATISTRSPEPLSLDDIINGVKKGVDKIKEKLGGGKKDPAPTPAPDAPASDAPASNSTLRVRMTKRTPEPLGIDDVINGVKAGIDLIKGLKGGDNAGNGDASGSKLSQIISSIKSGIDSLKNLFKGGKKGDDGAATLSATPTPTAGAGAGGATPTPAPGAGGSNGNSTARAVLRKRVVYLHA